MFNIYLSLEQENREQQGIEARDLEAGRQTELNSAGRFDGLIGLEPDQEKCYPLVTYLLTIKQSLQGLPRKEIEKKKIKW